ncbi:MAG: hypothetical protein UR68_C0021G0003 [Candidatus Roizmanbacteria bacterium GW2011_GWA2_35_19]|uniref:Polysaccharide pyruvyl transferase domain-containing protein n=2 Tax=Candidatus Roizmaniibacteriota TaxID=1752723 RepID=A0A0G0C7B7_9BACT|nr:MAG: hypothetical protein UR63_C0029G0006 [Candidatus Roizmanbacteria bacterium GW2011_GWC2_35_12]KKP72071.1 MAG: hypothetical protein UR68_C0021G0003 [Candidatus Roizmanbacteria bacterium GW2011_GWA2_35_19]
MKVLHTYCLNYNVGDYALGIGVKNIFRHLYNISFFAEVNLQGHIFDDYFINLINKKYDLLIIGGGGIIHGSHWPHGWFWLINKENIKKIKIPFIVYSAGYNYFKNEKGIPKRGIVHLKETQKQADFFSVRNDGSYERLLSQTGIKANVIADPAFWITLGRKFSSDLNKKYVIVQLADDKSISRFKSTKKRDDFIEVMINILMKLSLSYLIVFVPHVYEDLEISKKISSAIKNSIVLNFGEYAFDRSDEYIGIYKNSEFVLAMRGHGQIIPLSFGIPVISLENHYKHFGLMKEYGLEKYNVNILDKFFKVKLEDRISLLIKELNNLKVFINKKNVELFKNTVEMLRNIKKISRFLKDDS